MWFPDLHSWLVILHQRSSSPNKNRFKTSICKSQKISGRTRARRRVRIWEVGESPKKYTLASIWVAEVPQVMKTMFKTRVKLMSGLSQWMKMRSRMNFRLSMVYHQIQLRDWASSSTRRLKRLNLEALNLASLNRKFLRALRISSQCCNQLSSILTKTHNRLFLKKSIPSSRFTTWLTKPGLREMQSSLRPNLKSPRWAIKGFAAILQTYWRVPTKRGYLVLKSKDSRILRKWQLMKSTALSNLSL